MNIDRYAHIDSPVHAWDPRAKFVSLVLFVFASASVRHPSALLLVSITGVSLALCSRLPLRYILKSLKPVILFLVCMSLILAVTAGGDYIYSFGPFRLYREGIILAGAVSIRALSIMLVFIALFSTSRLAITMKAMQYLHIPSVMIQIFLFTYRYIMLYYDRLRNLRNAAKLRGFTLVRGLRNVKTAAGIAVNLIVSSFEQNERVYQAMQLRGFTGQFNTMTHFRMTIPDICKSILMIGISILIFMIEFSL